MRYGRPVLPYCLDARGIPVAMAPPTVCARIIVVSTDVNGLDNKKVQVQHLPRSRSRPSGPREKVMRLDRLAGQPEDCSDAEQSRRRYQPCRYQPCNVSHVLAIVRSSPVQAWTVRIVDPAVLAETASSYGVSGPLGLLLPAESLTTP